MEDPLMKSEIHGRPELGPWGEALFECFDQVADAFVFLKDSKRRLVRVSQPFVQLMGASSSSELLGLRDEDLSPEYLVVHYRGYDEQVLTEGTPIIDLVELVHTVDGSYDWFLTNKLPVKAPDGTVHGLVGVTRALTKRHAMAERIIPLTPAVELIAREFAGALTVAEMAAAVSMSPSHFARRFKEHFQVTPYRYLRRIRLMAACDLLSTTELPLSTIARQSGFCDQSHLSSEFSRERGMTPREYRQRFSQGGRSAHQRRIPLMGMTV
jgi:PAS domain S-box-containing protein